jgi:histidinol-phosphate aminotransferase
VIDDRSLGPLEQRVPEALRAGAAYHVPQPPNLRAKLDANELPFALPVDLRTRLGQALAEVALERYPDPNARELREVLARQLGVGGDQIVFGNGSDETIAFLISAFAGPRRGHEHGPLHWRPAAILYPTPSFVYYKIAAVGRGVEAIEVPLTSKLELDEDAIERAINAHHPSVVFLALPNNPTGTLWRMDFALELAARHRDICVVSDEAYFAYAGRTNLPHLAAHPNLVVMRTLSKVGMAGMRVGFSISSPAIAQLLEKLRPPYNVSSLDQRAAVFMLNEGRAWCDARAAEVVAERTQLAKQLSTLPGTEVFPSEANLLLVRFAGDGTASRIWQGLADRGVVVRNFDRPGTLLAGCLRITVGTPDENKLLIETLRSLS